MKKKDKPVVQFIIASIKISGQRIDNFLHNFFKKVPRDLIYRIVRSGEVRINKKRIKPDYRIHQNDLIRIPPIQKNERNNIQFISDDLKKLSILDTAIIYENDNILVLNKPSGMAVHGGSGINFGVIEGLRILRPYEFFLELVHRLDKNTSGILLIAKNRSTLKMLHEQFRLKKIKKEYLALVYGRWLNTTTQIIAPILKTTLKNGKRIARISDNGKFSETKFKVCENFIKSTLMIVTPVTGRTHQIRVHAQYAGHPIAFDDLYGDKIFNQELKQFGLNRLFLHSSSISFYHPEIKEKLFFKAKLDDTLCAFLECLRFKDQKFNKI